MEESSGEPFLNVVLVHPDIPQNAGNIARLTAANFVRLHFIEPMGFELTDKYLKRAGLDYWRWVDFRVYPSWEVFCNKVGFDDARAWFFSKKASVKHWDVSYKLGDYFVFGSETNGLPEEYLQRYTSRLLRIEMRNDNIRSLNIANSVAIALYEANRQIAK